MSIFAYAGMPGSGKSYNAVENQILPALREGRTVVTNVPVYVDKIREVCPTGKLVEFPLLSVKQNPETILEYVTPGCVFVLDECWEIWPSGDKTNKIPECYKTLLAKHRHMSALCRNPQTGEEVAVSTQIILLVQDTSNMAAFARKLIEQTFIHTKLSHVGMSQTFRVDIYHGPITGTIGPQNNRLNSVMGTYKPEICALYKSQTMAAAGVGRGSEKAVDRRGNVFRRPIFVFGIPIVLVCAGLGIWKLFADGKKYMHPETPVQIRDAQAQLHGQAVSAPLPGASHSSVLGEVFHGNSAPQYKVLGYVKNLEHPEKSYAVLSTGDRVRIFRGLDHCRVLDADFFGVRGGGAVFFSYWPIRDRRLRPRLHRGTRRATSG